MAQAKKEKRLTSKKWKCDKCGNKFENPIACTAVMCNTCTRGSSGIQKWMTPDD